MGEFSAPITSSFPRTEEAIYAYVRRMQATGKPWYISPELNSDLFPAPDGMGFLAALAAAVTSVASKVAVIAPKVASVVGTAQALKGGSGGGGGSAGPTADDIAAAILPSVQQQLAAQGVNLPGGVAQQAVAGSLLDSFGPQNRPLVIGVGALLGVLLLVTLLKR